MYHQAINFLSDRNHETLKANISKITEDIWKKQILKDKESLYLQSVIFSRCNTNNEA